MKKILILLCFILLAAAVAAWIKRDSLVGLLSMSRKAEPSGAENILTGEPAKNGKKVLIAYFSWGGNTRRVARRIREMTGGDLYEIRTAASYAGNYKAAVEQARQERESGTLPELAGELPEVKNYDAVLLGYPIWWGVEPLAVDAFATAAGLDGKTVLPFATSGSSGIESSVERLKNLFPNAEIRSGVLANITSRLQPWLEKNGMM